MGDAKRTSHKIKTNYFVFIAFIFPFKCIYSSLCQPPHFYCAPRSLLSHVAPPMITKFSSRYSLIFGICRCELDKEKFFLSQGHFYINCILSRAHKPFLSLYK